MAVRKSSQAKRELIQVETVAPRPCGSSLLSQGGMSRTMQPKTTRSKAALNNTHKTNKATPPTKKSAPVPVVTAEATPVTVQLPVSFTVALPASILEPPVRSLLSVRQKFGELRAAIAEGFEIQKPIYARPLWSSPDNSRIAYSFVLQREQVTRLITVPDGRTVQQFIREHDFLVDYRR